MPTALPPPPPHLAARLRERASELGLGEAMTESLLESLALVEREMLRSESYGHCARRAAVKAIRAARSKRTAERHIVLLEETLVLVRDGAEVRLAW